jgi:hypothetical protein
VIRNFGSCFKVGVATHNLQIRLIGALEDMKLLVQSHTRQRSASLLKWHRWFAWYPVVVRVDNELKHWVWLAKRLIKSCRLRFNSWGSLAIFAAILRASFVVAHWRIKT